MSEQEEEVTPVVFRKWPAREGGGVFALFPYMAASMNPYECGSYAHIGQHSAASIAIVYDTLPAKPEEYAALKAELEAEPYGYRLRVMHKGNTQAALAARRAQLEDYIK